MNALHLVVALIILIGSRIPERRAKNSGNEEARYSVQVTCDLHDISRQQLIVGRN